MEIVDLNELTGEELVGTLHTATLSGPRSTIPGDVVIGELVDLGDGHVYDKGNNLTPPQVQGYLLPYLVETGRAAQSLTDGVRALREEFGLTDNQPSSILVTKIQNKRQAENAHNDITADQEDLRQRLVAAFGPQRRSMGRNQEDWDRRAAQLDSETRTDLVRSLMRVRDQGSFNRVVGDVKALVGNFNYSGRREPAPVPAGVNAPASSEQTAADLTDEDDETSF